jgi:hypothetical protein
MKSTFFSNSQPNLIRPITVNKVNEVLYKNGNYVLPSMNTLFGNVYTEYVKPYAFIYIMLFIALVFLYYKYHTKETFNDTPVVNFNPNRPVKDQHSYVDYLPDDIPLNVNNNYITRHDFYNDNKKGDVKYEKIKLFNEKDREDDFTGLINPYEDYNMESLLDLSDVHPYGWNYSYDTSIKAIDEMTTQNRNASEYQDYLNNNVFKI